MPAPKGREGRLRFQKKRDPTETTNPLHLPRETYPEIKTPVTPRPYAAELAYLKHFKSLRSRIHDGPYYTVISSQARITKSRPSPFLGSTRPGSVHSGFKASGRSFGAMETYSQKERRPERTLPDLTKRHYVKAFFPEELHPYIDPSVQDRQRGPRKPAQEPLKLKDLSDAEEEAIADEEQDALEEEQDYDYEDDEDEDEANDYNAENYFDNGEDDDLGEEAGGGDYD